MALRGRRKRREVVARLFSNPLVRSPYSGTIGKDSCLGCTFRPARCPKPQTERPYFRDFARFRFLLVLKVRTAGAVLRLPGPSLNSSSCRITVSRRQRFGFQQPRFAVQRHVEFTYFVSDPRFDFRLLNASPNSDTKLCAEAVRRTGSRWKTPSNTDCVSGESSGRWTPKGVNVPSSKAFCQPAAVSVANGCAPVSISYATTPSAHTSDDGPARSPKNCSGAM